MEVTYYKKELFDSFYKTSRQPESVSREFKEHFKNVLKHLDFINRSLGRLDQAEINSKQQFLGSLPRNGKYRG